MSQIRRKSIIGDSESAEIDKSFLLQSLNRVFSQFKRDKAKTRGNTFSGNKEDLMHMFSNEKLTGVGEDSEEPEIMFDHLEERPQD